MHACICRYRDIICSYYIHSIEVVFGFVCLFHFDRLSCVGGFVLEFLWCELSRFLVAFHNVVFVCLFTPSDRICSRVLVVAAVVVVDVA